MLSHIMYTMFQIILDIIEEYYGKMGLFGSTLLHAFVEIILVTKYFKVDRVRSMDYQHI